MTVLGREDSSVRYKGGFALMTVDTGKERSRAGTASDVYLYFINGQEAAASCAAEADTPPAPGHDSSTHHINGMVPCRDNKATTRAPGRAIGANGARCVGEIGSSPAGDSNGHPRQHRSTAARGSRDCELLRLTDRYEYRLWLGPYDYILGHVFLPGDWTLYASYAQPKYFCAETACSRKTWIGRRG